MIDSLEGPHSLSFGAAALKPRLSG